ASRPRRLSAVRGVWRRPRRRPCPGRVPGAVSPSVARTEGRQVNEQLWLTCHEPWLLLGHIRQLIQTGGACPPAARRRAVLIACGCCRRVWPFFADARSRQAVELAEAWADRRVGPGEMDRAAVTAGQAEFDAGPGFAVRGAGPPARPRWASAARAAAATTAAAY